MPAKQNKISVMSHCCSLQPSISKFRQCQISTTCQHCDVCSCDAQYLDVLEVEGNLLNCAVHVQLLAVRQIELLDVQLPEA